MRNGSLFALFRFEAPYSTIAILMNPMSSNGVGVFCFMWRIFVCFYVFAFSKNGNQQSLRSHFEKSKCTKIIKRREMNGVPLLKKCVRRSRLSWRIEWAYFHPSVEMVGQFLYTWSRYLSGGQQFTSSLNICPDACWRKGGGLYKEPPNPRSRSISQRSTDIYFI